jgi:hypothetical protein
MPIREHYKQSAGEAYGHERVRWAEGLILQLPATHDGRNSWLLNYGEGAEAQALRAERGLGWDTETRSCQTPDAPGQIAE